MLLDGLALSLTVIITLPGVSWGTEGVPVICPVEALIVRGNGSPVAVHV